MFLFFGFLDLLYARKSELLFDLTTKRLLYGNNINKQRYPASLTKKMTLYIIFKALKEKRISFYTKFRVSKRASQQEPSKLGLRKGELITVKDLVYAIIIKSANDASYVAAEGLSGSVPRFVKEMNGIARDLGMHNTNFCNPSGLPNSRQMTTALDMVKLAYALYRDFPEYFSLFNKKYFYYKGRLINSHNKMLRYKRVDGLKTGYTSASGFNITTSAIRYDRRGRPHRLFAVVMGEDSAQKRDRKALGLLNRFFRVNKSR